MITERVQSILKDAELSPKEIVVYIALLSRGKTSAYALSKEISLKKPTIYAVLDTLILKGLARKIPSIKTQLYTAESPQILARNSKRNLERIQSIVPELLALSAKSDASMQTLFFEGIEGMRQAYWYKFEQLKATEFVGFYGSAHDLNTPLEAMVYEWNEKNRELGITSRTIAPDDPSLKDFRRLDAHHLRVTKKIPTNTYSSEISIEVTQLFVRISMFRAKQSIIIDSPSVATTFRQIFNMIWGVLP